VADEPLGREPLAGGMLTAQAGGEPGLAQSAVIVSAGNLASRILGLARIQAIAYLFGTGPLVDAFFVASQVPTLVYDLLIGGLLSSALVPVFSDYTAPERRDELWRLASIIFSLVASIMAVFIVLVELGAPWIALLMGGLGHGFDAATLDATTRMIRLMTPGLVFFGLSGASTGLLYTLKRFRYPAFAAAVFNATIIAAGVLLAPTLGIYSLAVGVLVGAIMQFVIQLPDLPRRYLRPIIDFDHPGVRRIGRLYLPILLGLVVSSAGVVIDRNLASRTGPGSIAWMANATTLIQGALGLVAVAVSLAALPSLAQHHATGDLEGFRQTLARGLRMILVLIVPATVGMFVLATPIIRLLLEHGQFTSFDTRQTSDALRLYLFGLPGAAIDWPLIFAFYARKDTLTPALVGVVTVLFYLLVAPALAFGLGVGFLGLVIANSVQLTSHGLIMLVLVQRRIGGLRGRGVGVTLAKTAAAALVMGSIAGAVARWLPAVVAVVGLAGQILTVGLTAAAGAAVYAAVAAWLGVSEIRFVWIKARRRLSRSASLSG
jgi:putative peptidoglycan lipid II flippase